MAKALYRTKLSAKESFDIRTMRYFIPKANALKARISYNDKVKIANLSSRGIQPKRRTPGFVNLLWGKTYRDLQISSWKEDIGQGFITKAEICESLPVWLREWAESKLQYAPYDVEGKTSRMFVAMYRSGNY